MLQLLFLLPELRFGFTAASSSLATSVPALSRVASATHGQNADKPISRALWRWPSSAPEAKSPRQSLHVTFVSSSCANMPETNFFAKTANFLNSVVVTMRPSALLVSVPPCSSQAATTVDNILRFAHTCSIGDRPVASPEKLVARCLRCDGCRKYASRYQDCGRMSKGMQFILAEDPLYVVEAFGVYPGAEAPHVLPMQ